MFQPQFHLQTLLFFVTYVAILCGWGKLLASWGAETWIWYFYPWHIEAKVAIVCYLVGYCCLLMPRRPLYAWQWGELGAFLLVYSYVWRTHCEAMDGPMGMGGALHYFAWGRADGLADLTQIIMLTIPLAYFTFWARRDTKPHSYWTICSLSICIVNAFLIYGVIELFHHWKYF